MGVEIAADIKSIWNSQYTMTMKKEDFDKLQEDITRVHKIIISND